MSERPRNPAEVEDGRLDGELDLAAIAKTGAALVLVVLIAAGLMYWLASTLRARGQASDPPPPALAEARVQQPPPGPRLQEHPERELAAMRAEEDAILESYAWVDETAGVARIPVTRAMEILAAGGPPAPPPAEGGAETP